VADGEKRDETGERVPPDGGVVEDGRRTRGGLGGRAVGGPLGQNHARVGDIDRREEVQERRAPEELELDDQGDRGDLGQDRAGDPRRQRDPAKGDDRAVEGRGWREPKAPRKRAEEERGAKELAGRPREGKEVLRGPKPEYLHPHRVGMERAQGRGGVQVLPDQERHRQHGEDRKPPEEGPPADPVERHERGGAQAQRRIHGRQRMDQERDSLERPAADVGTPQERIDGE